ncbi:MAG: glutaminase A [Muribaculaceae bacterium]
MCRINISKAQVTDAVNSVYRKYMDHKGGENAHYIPYLANVDSNLFGISVCMMDGTVVEIGDVNYKFGIESISKVPTAILAMKQCGAEEVLKMIGADSTGLPFNSIFALLLEKDHPSTPLVNAGAISACSMIKPIGDSDAKWQAIFDNITSLCGGAPELIEELYKSESSSNFNNRAITWLLKNYNRIYDIPLMSLDLYTRQCSLGVTAHQLSIMGATISNKGKNPLTDEQVFDGKLSSKIICMIASVGFYQDSGDWMYTSGIPAKSGVGGGILGVYPEVLGICAFAPPLDCAGNSVKGQLAVKEIAKILGLSIYG